MDDFGAQQKLIPNRESILEERGNGATVVTTVQKQVCFYVPTLGCLINVRCGISVLGGKNLKTK